MTSTIQLLKEALNTKLDNTPAGESIALYISREAAACLLRELEYVPNMEDDKK